MKKLILIASFIVFSFYASAQTGYYKSYNDYLNNNLISISESISFGHLKGKLQIVYKDSTGKKTTLNGSDIWGFKYKNHLFRVGRMYHENFYKVIAQDSAIYYQNGPAHFEMIKHNSNTGTKFGFYNALSNDLNSDIVPFDHHMKRSFKKQRKAYLAKHPELQPVFDCMAEKAKIAVIDGSECMAEYKK